MRSSRFLLPILLSVCAWSASAQEIFNFGRQAVVSPELTEETIVAVHEASASKEERKPFLDAEFANLSVEEVEELLRKAKE